MERLLRDKKAALMIALASLFVGIFSIAGIIFFIWRLLYVPMGICIALTAHGFYGCPFYFIRNANLKLCIRLLECREENPDAELSEIAEQIGIKEQFAEALLDKCKKKGYIED